MFFFLGIDISILLIVTSIYVVVIYGFGTPSILLLTLEEHLCIYHVYFPGVAVRYCVRAILVLSCSGVIANNRENDSACSVNLCIVQKLYYCMAGYPFKKRFPNQVRNIRR